MLRALDANSGDTVLASNYAYHMQDSGEYICPECKNSVILVKRSKVEWKPYFRHKRNDTCIYARYESSNNCKSAWHRKWQELFSEDEREVYFPDDEKGKGFIADVFFQNTVIEFQHSRMSEKEFFERTLFHTSHGRYVIWLFDVKCTGSQSPYLFQPRMKGNVLDWRWRSPFQAIQNYDSLVKECKGKVFLFFQKGKNPFIHNVLSYDNSFADFTTSKNLLITDFLQAVRDIDSFRGEQSKILTELKQEEEKQRLIREQQIGEARARQQRKADQQNQQNSNAAPKDHSSVSNTQQAPPESLSTQFARMREQRSQEQERKNQEMRKIAHEQRMQQEKADLKDYIMSLIHCDDDTFERFWNNNSSWLSLHYT